jgi:hypothetical protein
LSKKKLGEHLIESRLIKEPQLEEALRLQLKTNELLGKILQKLGFVSEEEVARALAEQLAMPFAAIEELDACQENINAFPLELALKRKIFPLGTEGGRLRLAMANPFDWQTVDEAAFTTGHKIVPVLATESAIMSVLRRYAGPSRGLDGVPSERGPGGEAEQPQGPQSAGSDRFEPIEIRAHHVPEGVSAGDPLPPNDPARLLADAVSKIKEGLAALESAISKIPPRSD